MTPSGSVNTTPAPETSQQPDLTESENTAQTNEAVSVVCVDFSEKPTINGEAFMAGFMPPLFFFTLGLCISIVIKSVKRVR